MKTLKCIAVSLLLAAGFAAAPAMAQEKPTLIVGAIYVGSVNDYGYNRSFKDGLEEMKKNIPGLKLLEAENVPETADSERVMESMIQQGAKLIFPTSFGHMDFAMNVAARHPDVYFYHAGGYKVTPNFGNFFGNTQTAWYPIGIAAGKMTKTNKIGFVVGQPIGYALGNVNAFEMGARSVNPKAQTIVVFTNS
jgi:basic membrane lipoprotein Med (substrate-binding protein (PBP1-ABC) superfamily)